AEVSRLPPGALLALADRLDGVGAQAEGGRLRRLVQRHRPGDFWANQDLGLALRALKPPALDEAVRYLTVAVALRPDSPGAYLNLGLALHAQGKWDEAAAAHRQALALAPKYVMAHNSLGNALRGLGQLDEAVAVYRGALALDPKNVTVHHNLSLVLRDQGKLDEAIAACRRTLALAPNYALAYGCW